MRASCRGILSAAPTAVVPTIATGSMRRRIIRINPSCYLGTRLRENRSGNRLLHHRLPSRRGKVATWVRHSEGVGRVRTPEKRPLSLLTLENGAAFLYSLNCCLISGLRFRRFLPRLGDLCGLGSLYRRLGFGVSRRDSIRRRLGQRLAILIDLVLQSLFKL